MPVLYDRICNNLARSKIVLDTPLWNQNDRWDVIYDVRSLSLNLDTNKLLNIMSSVIINAQQNV